MFQWITEQRSVSSYPIYSPSFLPSVRTGDATPLLLASAYYVQRCVVIDYPYHDAYQVQSRVHDRDPEYPYEETALPIHRLIHVRREWGENRWCIDGIHFFVEAKRTMLLTIDRKREETSNWIDPRKRNSRCHVSRDITYSRIETDHHLLSRPSVPLPLVRARGNEKRRETRSTDTSAF